MQSELNIRVTDSSPAAVGKAPVPFIHYSQSHLYSSVSEESWELRSVSFLNTLQCRVFEVFYVALRRSSYIPLMKQLIHFTFLHSFLVKLMIVDEQHQDRRQDRLMFVSTAQNGGTEFMVIQWASLQSPGKSWTHSSWPLLPFWWSVHRQLSLFLNAPVVLISIIKYNTC